MTDTTYEYRWKCLHIPSNVTRFTFKVKATNDVHIALSAANMNLKNFYEIGKCMIKNLVDNLMNVDGPFLGVG